MVSYEVLKEDDQILKINNKKINTLLDWGNKQTKLKPNEIVIIRVKRRNQELNRAIRTISLEEFETKTKTTSSIGDNVEKVPPEKDVENKNYVCQKTDSYKKLKSEDLIYSINSVLVKSREDFQKK